jgi:hypothetical protein
VSVQSDRVEITANPAAELRSLIDDLNGRIERQVKRIERVQVSATPRPRSAESPAAELQTILAEMVATRDAKQAELDRLEGAEVG